MPARIENETAIQRKARITEQARIRAARYYKNHTDKVLQKRKDDWQKLKLDAQRETLANLPTLNQNVYEPEPQPEPEYFEPIYEPPPVVVETRRSTRVRKPAVSTPEVVESVPLIKQRGRPKGATSKTVCKDIASIYTPEYVKGKLSEIDNQSKGTTKTNLDAFPILQGITSPYLDCDWKAGLSKPTLITQMIDNALKKDSTEKYGTNSKKVFVSLILKIIDKIIPEVAIVKPKYENYFNVLKAEGMNEDKIQMVNVYRYDKLKEKIFEKFGVNSKQRLLTSLYGEITVRDNFSKLLVINKKSDMKLDKETNYLILPSSENGYRAVVYLQKYKTVGKYEDLEFTCSEELTDEIMAYYKKYIQKIQKSGYYLFGKSLLSGYIGTMLKKIGIDNKGMAVNYFRHSVALSLDKSNKDAQSLVNLAKDMGHSLMTHLRYTSHNIIEE